MTHWKRDQILRQAGELLEKCLDYEKTMQQIAELAVWEGFACWCVVDLVSQLGSIERVAVAHVDPSKANHALKIKLHYPAKPTAQRGVYRVIEAGVPILIPSIRESGGWEKRADDEEHLRIIHEMGSDSYMCVPMRARGKVVGSVMFFTDQRVFSESDLSFAQELGRFFALAVDNAAFFQRAKQAIQMRDEFLAAAAHELRTPLTPLTLLPDLFERSVKQQGNPEEKMRGLFETSREQVRRLNAVVNQLLEYIAIEGDGMGQEREEVDLAGMVRRISRDLLQESGQPLSRVENVDEGALLGSWNRFRLQQALVHLFSSLLKHGGGAALKTTLSGNAKQATLLVESRREGGDSGVYTDWGGSGSDEAAQKALPKRNALLRVGVHIARSIVLQHGGTFDVRNDPGQGVVFTIRLPISRSQFG